LSAIFRGLQKSTIEQSRVEWSGMESESESSKYSVPELSEADAELINSTELYNFEKQRIKIRVSKAAVKLCD